MQVSKETITPKKAMEWLKRNINNRPPSQNQVARLVAVLRAGRYRLNGETIKFNSNGDLIDGQHRLMACIESGVSFESYVVRGLPHDTFETLDGHRPRSGSNDMSIRGEKNTTTLAAACRGVYLLTTKGIFSEANSVRRDQISDTLKEHPGIRDSVDYATVNRANIIGRSIVATLHYLFSQKNAKRAAEFWGRVLGGEGLTAGMPEYRLRERLIKEKAAMGRLRAPDVYALVIKAWNAGGEGGTIKQLKYGPDEEFPKIK